MNRVVIDASMALAWCFPDESSTYADSVLVGLKGKKILVPAIWGLEIANAFLVGERKKRLHTPDVLRFTTLLKGLPITEDVRTPIEHVRDVLPLAREHELSAYNAAYLELALRSGASLATLDNKLERAARRSGVSLFRDAV